MKKVIKVFAIILFVTIFQFKQSNAYSTRLNHVDVYVNGEVIIDKQVNGVSQDCIKTVVNVSNISISIKENGKTKGYKNFTEQTQANSNEKEYHKNVEGFTKNAIIIVNGKITSKELNIDMNFSKTYSGTDIEKAIQECPCRSGCDIRITSEEVKNIITYDVTFKSENGGKLKGNESSDNYIQYANMVSGDKFPNVPEVSEDENYKFLGWYNEKTDEKISKFPNTIAEDLAAVAKFEYVEPKKDETNFIVDNNNTVLTNDVNAVPETNNTTLNNDIVNNNITVNNTLNSNSSIENTIKNNIKLEKSNNDAVMTAATPVEEKNIVSSKNSDNNTIITNINESKNLEAYNPPKTAVENNIVLLIVSFIICLTITIGVATKIRKDNK